MATSNSIPTNATNVSQAATLTYQQAMQSLNSIVPSTAESGVVTLQPNTLTTVTMQAGKHFKVRKIGNDGVTLQTPDNVVAVRHGDSLHVRYADGSVVHFDEFYANCADNSVCSVALAGDGSNDITLSAADAAGGPVADDGLLVYAHGNPDVLLAMAQDQSALTSAILALGNGATVAYEPANSHLGVFALAAVALAAAANSNTSSSTGIAPLSGESASAAQERALATISNAAQANTANDTSPAASVYAAAGVTGVSAANLASVNSALNSAAIDGAAANNPSELQAIVNAYSAILASADGRSGNTATPLSAAQYTSIGVAGVSGVVAQGTALNLLDSTVDGSVKAAVDSEVEVQAMADAAAHVIAAAGGSTTQAAAVTLEDMTALGVAGVTNGNLSAIQTAIQSATPIAVDTQPELQRLVNTKLGSIGASLNAIADAAEANTATSSALKASLYTAANVTGVTADNLAAINSALDSPAVNAAAADTSAEVQTIVDAYSAVLASADGKGGNTTTPLTGAQYSAIGLTGLSGTAAPGTPLQLLDSAVDASTAGKVDSVDELQAMANAAAHVMTGAAGGLAPTLIELQTLGVTGVDSSNLAAVQAAIAATPDNGTGVDTLVALQAVVTEAAANTRPMISTTLANVTNLDVTSHLVLSANQSITIGTGFITISDEGGGTGYQNDTSTNTQSIAVATAVQSGLLTITGTGADTKIIINPTFDLDLSSNYKLTISEGAFRNAGGTQDALPFAAVTFSTVTPGVHTTGGTAATEAKASQTMSDSTGALMASKFWMDIQGLSSANSSVTQLDDLGSNKAYALVMKNYATAPGGDPLTTDGDGGDGMAARDTHVSVTSFGADDVIYLDAQLNDPTKQRFDGHFTQMINGSDFGGLPGQSALAFGAVAVPQQEAGSANVWLGFEGNTAKTIYGQIYTVGTDIGWANAWHPLSAPVVMG